MSSSFKFAGPVSASKSLFNRALIIQSFQPEISIIGNSQSEDVLAMRSVLTHWQNPEHLLDCRDAGTVFRFLLPRLSRQPGRYKVGGSLRLLSRPHGALFSALQSLGVQVEVKEGAIIVTSSGWINPGVLQIDGSFSSQFLSGILLSAWQLPFDFSISLPDQLVSSSYFLMTRQLCEWFGMDIREEDGGRTLIIPQQQQPKIKAYFVEPDLSSCFAVAALAVVGGAATIEPFPQKSLQPDFAFIEILRAMGVSVDVGDHSLRVSYAKSTQAIHWNLNTTPDLFPVLAVLAARSEGVSRFIGLGHLKYKESDRLQNVKNLLQRCGRSVEEDGGVFIIHGRSGTLQGSGEFDPDGDHRMVMAAQVANFSGASFKILNPQVVDKSFPEFWSFAGAST